MKDLVWNSEDTERDEKAPLQHCCSCASETSEMVSALSGEGEEKEQRLEEEKLFDQGNETQTNDAVQDLQALWPNDDYTVESN